MKSWLSTIRAVHAKLLDRSVMKSAEILASLEAKHPGEKEFLQAVKEVLLSVEEVYNQHPEFLHTLLF